MFNTNRFVRLKVGEDAVAASLASLSPLAALAPANNDETQLQTSLGSVYSTLVCFAIETR